MGSTHLRRRDNLPDYELFQADFDSDIDSEVRDSDGIGVEISDEAFPDESNVDFVDQTVAVRDVVENRDNVAISSPGRKKKSNNPILNGWETTTKGRLPPKSRFRSGPEEGITIEKLKKFIALTFYFGVVKKIT